MLGVHVSVKVLFSSGPKEVACSTPACCCPCTRTPALLPHLAYCAQHLLCVAACLRCVQEWGKEHGHDASVLLGVEDVFRRDPAAGAGSGWGVGAGRIGLQFQQWTLAGAPHHPVFCGMPDLIQ